MEKIVEYKGGYEIICHDKNIERIWRTLGRDEVQSETYNTDQNPVYKAQFNIEYKNGVRIVVKDIDGSLNNLDLFIKLSEVLVEDKFDKRIQNELQHE